MIVASAAASTAFAQQAQYSSKDIIDTFAKKPTATPAAPAGECEKRGMITGDDGVCEPVKDSRGFSLPTRANLHAVASAPVRGATAKPGRTVAHVERAPPQPVARRDLLITFKTGSAELTDQAKANAKVFAAALDSSALAASKFDISGYTDASGDKDKNQALSEARAASVKAYLVSQGVSETRLDTHGYGASDFAVPSDPTSARNRRVEAKRVD